MKTYGELKDFVRRTGVIHECVPMISSFTSIEGDGDRLSVRKDGVTRGFRFGMLNVDARRKMDSWIWFRCADRTLREDSSFFFEQRYLPGRNKVLRGTKERAAAYAAIGKRDR